MRNKAMGFSLIEILVVITIIGLLIAISGGAYHKYITQGERAKTRALITELEEYAGDYNDRRGDFPPSSLKHLGLATTGSTDNEGIEAFVQALFASSYDGHRPDSTSDLINSDGDEADKKISLFGERALFEFQDAWGNPVIYIRHTDYKKSFFYWILEESIGVHALKNPETGTYYRFESCQIISAGPDGLFDTEDDIANFERLVPE
ncbi:MAG: prepilin-type N-terminal cleavage/methylation domain-containing protein [Planctomycetota bacterium]|jgi:prepilin-type N-terminal cleavage/methylation domain-containing protein